MAWNCLRRWRFAGGAAFVRQVACGAWRFAGWRRGVRAVALGDRATRGGGGCCLAIWAAARRAGAQGRPAQRGRGAWAALCDRPPVRACYGAILRRSPGRRAPQRSRAKADRP